MSFTIKSIELNNIRAHNYFSFEPATKGVTAISGENGAGKSTIVDAFAWCLYGTRPSGVKNKNLIKDGVDPKEKPVSVKTILNMGGLEYAIERKIITAAGATECNVWARKPDSKEHKQIAGPSVTHVEKFLKNEIGMNEKGFLTSVLIQQKQVDQIVSATPRERGAVIEELTGIASITQAIIKTNENTRALEKAASIFQIGNIDEAEGRVEKQKEVCNSIEERQKEAVLKFNQMREILANLTEELKVEDVKVKKRIELTQNAETFKRQIEFLKTQAKDDLEYIVKFKEKYGSTIAVDVDKIKNEINEKRTSMYTAESTLNSLNKELSTIINNLSNCVSLKGDFKNEKEASSLLTQKKEELESKLKQLEELKNDESMYNSEIKHSKASKEHISGEHKNCPVCKSSIEDPESLRSEIEEDIKNFEDKKNEAKKEMKTVSAQIYELNEAIKSIEVSIVAIKEEKKMKKEKKEIETQIKEISLNLELIKSDVKGAEDEYSKAIKIQTDNRLLEGAKERSLTVNKTIQDNENKMKSTLAQIDELNALSDRSHAALIKRVDEAKERVGKMSIAGKELMGRKQLEYERLSDYEKDLAKVQEAMKKYNELAEQIEVSSSASAMLSAFKADRIENAIPTLEFYASDFLSKFTAGTFAKLSVDEKFNTFVTTSTGVVRPVSQLSGGELSAAAIALRLGIAMLLNSSEKNVLILDEVLVSMDEERARQIMETISSMTNSQVIFIAHNSDINSIADKTVLVTK